MTRSALLARSISWQELSDWKFLQERTTDAASLALSKKAAAEALSFMLKSRVEFASRCIDRYKLLSSHFGLLLLRQLNQSKRNGLAVLDVIHLPRPGTVGLVKRERIAE